MFCPSACECMRETYAVRYIAPLANRVRAHTSVSLARRSIWRCECEWLRRRIALCRDYCIYTFRIRWCTILLRFDVCARNGNDISQGRMVYTIVVRIRSSVCAHCMYYIQLYMSRINTRKRTAFYYIALFTTDTIYTYRTECVRSQAHVYKYVYHAPAHPPIKGKHISRAQRENNKKKNAKQKNISLPSRRRAMYNCNCAHTECSCGECCFDIRDTNTRATPSFLSVWSTCIQSRNKMTFLYAKDVRSQCMRRVSVGGLSTTSRPYAFRHPNSMSLFRVHRNHINSPENC